MKSRISAALVNNAIVLSLDGVASMKVLAPVISEREFRGVWDFLKETHIFFEMAKLTVEVEGNDLLVENGLSAIPCIVGAIKGLLIKFTEYEWDDIIIEFEDGEKLTTPNYEHSQMYLTVTTSVGGGSLVLDVLNNQQRNVIQYLITTASNKVFSDEIVQSAWNAMLREVKPTNTGVEDNKLVIAEGKIIEQIDTINASIGIFYGLLSDAIPELNISVENVDLSSITSRVGFTIIEKPTGTDTPVSVRVPVKKSLSLF